MELIIRFQLVEEPFPLSNFRRVSRGQSFFVADRQWVSEFQERLSSSPFVFGKQIIRLSKLENTI